MPLRVTITIGYLIIYSPFLAFFLLVSLWNSKWILFGVICILTIIMVRAAQKVFNEEKFSRFVTAISAILFGAAYGIQLFRRILFMIQEGGMEPRNGDGSPVAFLIGMVGEIFLLALPALAFTLLAVFCTKAKIPETTESNQTPEPAMSSAAQKPHQD